MPRPLRIEYENALYHVMNGGRGKNPIVFDGQEYYQAFLTTLAEAHQRFGIQIHAYCLMDSYYQLLARTPRANLSRCMRHINGLYTQRYNHLRSTDGPLFRGRYKAILAEEELYLLRLTRHIHLSPTETNPALVDHLETYRWSSYPAYINKAKSPAWLYREPAYRILGRRQRYWAYRKYVETEIDEELKRFFGRAHRAPILGTKGFVSQIKERESKNPGRSALDMQLPTIEQIILSVSQQFQTETTKITHTSRGRGARNVARWMAMYLCHEIAGHSLRDIATAFHLGHISGVNQQVRRLKEEAKVDPGLRKILNALIQELTS